MVAIAANTAGAAAFAAPAAVAPASRITTPEVVVVETAETPPSSMCAVVDICRAGVGVVSEGCGGAGGWDLPLPLSLEGSGAGLRPHLPIAKPASAAGKGG